MVHNTYNTHEIQTCTYKNIYTNTYESISCNQFIEIINI